eukprot:COSAG01_NODE_4017_length_5430_cov_4.544926_7_plen_216_part_00
MLKRQIRRPPGSGQSGRRHFAARSMARSRSRKILAGKFGWGTNEPLQQAANCSTDCTGWIMGWIDRLRVSGEGARRRLRHSVLLFIMTPARLWRERGRRLGRHVDKGQRRSSERISCQWKRNSSCRALANRQRAQTKPETKRITSARWMNMRQECEFRNQPLLYLNPCLKDWQHWLRMYKRAMRLVTNNNMYCDMLLLQNRILGGARRHAPQATQ